MPKYVHARSVRNLKFKYGLTNVRATHIPESLPVFTKKDGRSWIRAINQCPLKEKMALFKESNDYKHQYHFSHSDTDYPNQTPPECFLATLKELEREPLLQSTSSGFPSCQSITDTNTDLSYTQSGVRHKTTKRLCECTISSK